MGKSLLKYSIIILVLIGGCNLDYHTKKWAESNMKNAQTLTIIKNFVDIGFTENRGMIFGAFNNKMSRLSQTIFIVIRIIILVTMMIFIWIYRKRSFLFLFPLLLLSIGAAGNLIDPFKYGYVVDFIHIHAGNILNWPFYFNMADAYITIGVFIMLLKEIIQPGQLIKS